jgi:hypothetical protein
VDETAERLQGRTGSSKPPEDGPSTEDRPSWDTNRGLETLRRVARDPGSWLRVAILAVGLVILVAAMWSRRRPPRTAEELLLERSRETLDRARETLETIASRLPSVDR